MTNNVISLNRKRVERPDNTEAFIGDFVTWAKNQGVNTSTEDFKHESAVIMLMIKNMLIKSGVA